MNPPIAVTFRCLLRLVFATTLVISADAAVTNVAWYRLGENDPGAASGAIANSTTLDLVGGQHLNRFGSPRYTNAVSTAAGSSLAVHFDGSNQYFSNAVVSTAVDNFGLEAWVRPDITTTGNRSIACNGSTLTDGWAIFQKGGGSYSATFGGVASFGAATAVAGTWTHLALVRDNGATTFYVDGVVSGTNAGVPVPPATGFTIGTRPQASAGQLFNGVIDEVRVFTFAPGGFSTNDLLFNLQRVATLVAGNITPTNATLNGSLNPVGLPTSGWFQWGTTTNYGNVTPAQPFGSGGNTNFSQTLGGLSGGVTYHFRAVGSNALGIAFGTNQSFITPVLVVLFSDNFNTDSSSLWTVNYAPVANANLQSATFAFDYSAFGIPPAPGSSDTLGLRLRSNIPIVGGVEVTTRPAGVTSGLSVSPTGKNFGISYHLSFYAWVNFNGAPNASGLADNANSEGGTHNVLFAVGTSGTVPLVVGNTALVTDGQMDGIAFATTGDGGITSDYRVYPKSGTIVPGTTPGVYAAGTSSTANQNGNAYYTSIPSLAPHTAPAVQQSLSTAEYGSDAANTQAGSTQAGTFGFAWHKVDVTKSNNIVSWTIDDVAIATFDVYSIGLVLGGNNIAVGDSDVNTSTTRHPFLVFTLIDNLVVTGLSVRIQSSFSNGTLHLSWPEEPAGGAVPQYADSLSSPVLWSNVVATATTNSGTVSLSVPATNAQRYFRLKQ